MIYLLCKWQSKKKKTKIYLRIFFAIVFTVKFLKKILNKIFTNLPTNEYPFLSMGKYYINEILMINTKVFHELFVRIITKIT
jgi:hypothetical protein